MHMRRINDLCGLSRRTETAKGGEAAAIAEGLESAPPEATAVTGEGVDWNKALKWCVRGACGLSRISLR